MAGFCAFGGSRVGISSMILTVVYAFTMQPIAAGIALVAGAIAFGLMSNAFFRH
ncbi:MAG TPA: hypothetical protein VKW04_20350 [Planctomycetota bacterium]|nr:hypothetical protein [Planctomycetota bacterium]